jgi:electron transfer flavoprotein alpha subunit
MTGKHLIIVEHDNNTPSKSTYCAIVASSNIAKETTALILAKNKEISDSISKHILKHVDKIYCMHSEDFTNQLSQNYASAIEHIVTTHAFNYVWAGSSTFIKEAMPRVCARLTKASMLSDIQKVVSEDTFERQMWAGDIIAKVRMLSEIKIITVRPTDFQGTPKESASLSNIEEVAFNVVNESMKFISFDQIKSDRPSLSDASVIVSGGRGLKTPENFNKHIFPLADLLHAAVGASRAICDADWVPNDWQVGQTGKVVAPSLYFAIGISGAIQHVAGMRGSKTIVAINKDVEAPIFQVADYGLVGDALEIVPELTEKIKKMLS